MKNKLFSKPHLSQSARILVASCTLPLLIACESTPSGFESSLIPESHRKGYQLSMSKAKACPVNLAELADTRSSKDLLVGGSKLTEDTLYDLLQQSLESMNVSPSIEARNSVKVVLNRAFVKSLGSNMVATVVLDVMYKPDLAEDYSPAATFRGRSVNVNVGEENNNQVAIEAMKTAIDDATKRIKSSLLHNCGDALSELEAV